MWINHTSDSQSNRTDHKWFQNGCNKYVYPIHFVVYCYINNSLYSDWKYARILVCRHYLFWDVNSSERMKLEENCELWGTMMFKDKYTSIFSCQMEAIIFTTLQIFLQCMDKIFVNNLLFNFQCPKVWLGKQTNMSLLSSPIKF